MQTFMETQQKQLRKKFHTLLRECGIGQDGKEAILASYGVESSRDLTYNELAKICNNLSIQSDPKQQKLIQSRDRVIAAISAYHVEMGEEMFQKNYDECTPAEKEQRRRYARGTAKKASAGKDFYDLTVKELQGLYGTFIKNAKFARNVNEMRHKDFLYKRICPN